MGHGEVFLISEYVDGELYARDLSALTTRDAALPVDLARAEALANYLAEVHAKPADPAEYGRAIRDLVGSGEGIFGLIDSYPPDCAPVPISRLKALEARAIGWRWRLRDKSRRARRTHGDFHPFNILFRDGVDFTVLDCSRGGVGEPADDVVALAINYLFFARNSRPRFDGPLREVWSTFWRTYLAASKDTEILEIVPPFFAWRALVLASPVWYPNVSDALRDELLTLAERLLDGAPFTPDGFDRLLGAS